MNSARGVDWRVRQAGNLPLLRQSSFPHREECSPSKERTMKLLATVFPAKPHVDDLDPTFAFLARALLVCGLICFVWSGYFLAQWTRSLAFQPTTGRVSYGALRFVQDHVTNVSFDYVVEGRTYLSQNIAIGGVRWAPCLMRAPSPFTITPAIPKKLSSSAVPSKPSYLRSSLPSCRLSSPVSFGELMRDIVARRLPPKRIFLCIWTRSRLDYVPCLAAGTPLHLRDGR